MSVSDYTEMGDHRNIWSFMGVVLLVTCISGEDPYRFYSWNVTYGDIYPLGEKQQVSSSCVFSFALFA